MEDIVAKRIKIIEGIKNFTDVAVVGLSGGADSLLVALLSLEALGAENVYTVGMPYGKSDELHFNSLSKKYADHLKIHYRDANIRKIADSIAEASAIGLGISVTELSDLNKGNARSRARMSVLYSMCHHLGAVLGKRVRVSGTGNLSEDYLCYDTKGGDALSDFFPIGDLFKSEVYALLENYRDRGFITDDMINRIPSAGLWEGQTDQDELGFSYNDMQPAVEFCLTDPELVDEIIKDRWFGAGPHELEALCVRNGTTSQMLKFVRERHLANKHKHEAAPVISLRVA